MEIPILILVQALEVEGLGYRSRTRARSGVIRQGPPFPHIITTLEQTAVSEFRSLLEFTGR